MSAPAQKHPAQKQKHRFLWDQQKLGMNVWDAAVERMIEAYNTYDAIEVLTSGGKDSMGAMEVTVEAARRTGNLPVKVSFHDDEVVEHETLEYIRRLRERDDIDLDWVVFPTAARNACTSEDDSVWVAWHPDEEHLWVRDLPPESINIYNNEMLRAGWDPERPMNFAQKTNWWAAQRVPGKRLGLVLGIRAAESLVRRQVVSYRRTDNYIIKVTPTLHKVYPIYDWDTSDLWTAAGDFGWDYNQTYDLYEMLGVAPDDQRIGTPFADEPLERIHLWQETAPDIWDKMLDRVPGAQAAARYGRSELYAYGSLPEKPDGVEWMDFIRQVLMNHESEAFRGQNAKKIKSILARHYRKTSDPVLEVAHPITGCSWGNLLRIAIRGDSKNRKEVSGFARGNPEKYAAALAEYRKESRR